MCETVISSVASNCKTQKSGLGVLSTSLLQWCCDGITFYKQTQCYNLCTIYFLMAKPSISLKHWHIKGPRPFLGPFLKFGQAIVDAIFAQKISYFRWICGLVLPSRRTNFYKIPISNLGAMPQKQNYFPVWAARAAKKLFILKLFWVGFFLINS
jgi:hypothetical protein